MQFNIFKFWHKPDTWHRLKPLLLSSEIDFILSCQNINGGFSNMPHNQSYLETCYYSLVCLGLTQSEHLCNSNILNYILAHYCSDGGFADQPGYKNSNIFNSFYAVVCLSMLDSLVYVKSDRTVKYFLNKLNSNGGFVEENNGPPSLIHTYWSILSLELLNASNTINKDQIRKFVLSCRTTNGLYSNYPNSQFGYLEYTGYALILNSVLSLDINFNADPLLDVINQRKIDNGYSSYYKDDHNFSDTFWGLYLTRTFDCKATYDRLFLRIDGLNVWQVYISLILRLLYDSQRVIPNYYHILKLNSKSNITRLGYQSLRLDSSFQDVQFLGFELYKSLNLNEKRILKENIDSGILLDIDPDILNITWENILIGNSLLQLMFPVARANKCKTNEDYINLKVCLIIYDPKLTSSVLEQKACKSLLEKYYIDVVLKSYDEIEISTELKRNNYQLIHLTGHCSEDGILNKEKGLKLIDIIDNLYIIEFSGLFICNICNVNTDSLYYFKKAEYTIVSFCGLLNGLVGYDFIIEVFSYMLSKNNIGESIRLAKIKLLFSNKENLSYLNYLLWGNPNLYF
jgi:hypothetical protein